MGTWKYRLQRSVRPRWVWIGERRFGQDTEVPGCFPFYKWTWRSTKLTGASKRNTLNGEEDVGSHKGKSARTMDLIGHKVRVKFADRGCV